MLKEPKQSTKYAILALMAVVLLGGLTLLTTAVMADEAPIWRWVVGGLATLLGGGYVYSFISFRMRYPTREAREAYRDQLIASHPDEYARLTRGKIAYQATKYKKLVLRSEVDGTATVTFIADGHRGNEFERLVYLELDVSVADGEPYQVKTGEYLNAASSGSVAPGRRLIVKVDPADPQRVAIDWERSLRLRDC